jgi:hypothetical protein
MMFRMYDTYVYDDCQIIWKSFSKNFYEFKKNLKAGTYIDILFRPWGFQVTHGP